jgi:hypothetical protein
MKPIGTFSKKDISIIRSICKLFTLFPKMKGQYVMGYKIIYDSHEENGAAVTERKAVFSHLIAEHLLLATF